MHTADKYVIMQKNLIGNLSNGERAVAIFEREVLLVQNLKPNMLMGVDCLVPEKFDIMEDAELVNR